MLPLRPHHHEFAPPTALKHAVKCFWTDRIEGGPLPSAFEVLPDGCAEIIFHFGGACGMVMGGRVQRLPSPFLMGLLTQPVMLQAQGRVDILAIRCYPWAVYDLLGLPAGQDGVRRFDHPVARLQPTLARCIEAGHVDEALAHLERHFTQAASGIAPDAMLLRAGAALREGQGTLSVSAVAAAAHATVRTLERRFKLRAGYTVKEVSGVMRFEGVRNSLFAQPHGSIAGLAQALGYVDQSHLSREFKRYTGTTPAAFAQRLRKS
ncbi:AraC-like DNA-binding protein [Pseudoduganella lurida]|uniref:AraC-like DNA-binding protein n=1 Tax=Pseudoduganella lurida TaxID=1036180 RepID=A0A562R8L0_9BURK|nr:helix-turn-helix domain-containing protein [Pseudoduganella lurida]TWI65409.1 AraC-like DNA-binding protein [Pseudoduganella lurida]